MKPMKDNIPNVKYVCIENAGHLSPFDSPGLDSIRSYLQVKEKFNFVVAEFLSQFQHKL